MNAISLSTHFKNYFQIILACTPELVSRVQRIRYEVYCREFHYESEENCPAGLERDEYDENSLHCLVVYTAGGADAGCVRLIKTPADNLDYPLPLEKFCAHSLTHPILHPKKLPRTDIAEISRLAVHTNFRRRLGESESPFGRLSEVNITEEERRTFPLISFALFAAGAALMALSHKNDLFIMVEPRLAKRLQNLGLPFIQIGELLDYHGMRAAYHVTTEQLLKDMRGEMRELYDYVYSHLKIDFDKAGLHPIQ